jgi:hypothetical protein
MISILGLSMEITRFANFPIVFLGMLAWMYGSRRPNLLFMLSSH